MLQNKSSKLKNENIFRTEDELVHVNLGNGWLGTTPDSPGRRHHFLRLGLVGTKTQHEKIVSIGVLGCGGDGIQR